MQVTDLFRRLVFAQVLLGIVAFCMAEPNPALLLIAGALGALSWYVTEGPAGRPLPRWTINLGALAAVGWLLFDLYRRQGEVILGMGHFTMWLQVLMLYSEKNNRDYAQLLVLSLLQMIGASVLPGGVSMIFGLMLTAYCVLALFTVLLFQLKTAADTVHDANKAAAPSGSYVARPKAVVSRGHRWQFRTAAVLVGIQCSAIAMIVFIVTPRLPDVRLGQTAGNPLVTPQTGFSREVQLGTTPLGSGSKEPVLNLVVRQDGQNIGSEERPWLLRGASLDWYEERTHTWRRGNDVAAVDGKHVIGHEGVNLAEVDDDLPMIEADITLRSPDARTLFTLHPVAWVDSQSLSQVLFSAVDQQLNTVDAVNNAVMYRLRAPLDPPAGFFGAYGELPTMNDSRPRVIRGGRGWGRDDGEERPRMRIVEPRRYASGWHVQATQVRRLTERILADVGLQRDVDAEITPEDEQIARVLSDYLRNNYRYALVNPTVAQQDPVVDFLFTSRRGHCELFAAGLAAMARSIGMQARVITGYRAGEFNRIGGYYIVRQSNAHAWTEIFVGEHGWRVFDATPPEEIARIHFVRRTWLTSLRELYEHMEFKWISTIVAYDMRTREKVLANINQSISSAASNHDTWFGQLIAWVRDLPQMWELDRISYTLVAVISFFIIIGCLSLIHTLVVRRRRLVALQLTALPRGQRRGLARRLRFYLRMLDMLERHGYVRPSWQSPFSFARELAEANPLRFDPVIALTEQFYEIRFGHRPLDELRRNLIKAHLRQLEHALAERPT